MSQRYFASDNNSGAFPEVLEKLQEINTDHVTGYGDDPYTAKARDMISELFERESAVFFVSTGTAANCLALSAMVKSYEAVITHRHSHLETDESHAIGLFAGGVQLLTGDSPLGKLEPESLKVLVADQRSVHSSKPAAVSLSNATELGTVYTPSQIAAISLEARRLGLKVHMDGARFANALAFLKCSPAELTWKSGVDALSFGGTKNGLLFGEAVVFFDPLLAAEFEWRMKKAGQLTSKMRFLAGQWLAVLRNSLWLKRAGHANAMAQKLRTQLDAIGIECLYPTEANAVFAKIPQEKVAYLHELGWHFYTGPGWGSRLMCSWDTSEIEVDEWCQLMST
jgi:threonine aldolase